MGMYGLRILLYSGLLRDPHYFGRWVVGILSHMPIRLH